MAAVASIDTSRYGKATKMELASKRYSRDSKNNKLGYVCESSDHNQHHS